MSRKGTLFVITGPSGAGKGTVLKKVIQSLDRLYFSVSATTRAPREGELDGVHYHFLTHEQFERLIAEERLLEYAQYAKNYYGTPLDPALQHLEMGEDVILEIELQGALQVKKRLPSLCPCSSRRLLLRNWRTVSGAVERRRRRSSSSGCPLHEKSARPWTSSVT